MFINKSFIQNELSKMFNIKKSLLCISAISCMSLYASIITAYDDYDDIETPFAPTEVTNPITIGSTPSVPTETDYNYWSTEEDNTYVFNRSTSNSHKYWIAYNKVTIDNGYTLKLINEYGMYTLYCFNTFTNNGNVIIDKYSRLDLINNNPSTNNGTINVINGRLGLHNSATLNNTGTITLKDNSYIYISIIVL